MPRLDKLICLAAPAGTPQAIVNKLRGDIVKVMAMHDIKERFGALGADPVGNTPEEFSAYLKDEIVKWGRVVKDSGAKVD
jgi:tripartite-type tricarboxylate transporter receptor subunit TctC